jgi:signal transduction histidine kinase
VKLTLERIAGEGCAQEERSSLLTSCIQLTDSVISQTRSLIFDLYPTMLDDLGLVATLRWYAEKVPAAGCRMDIFEVGERRPLGSSLRGYLYRAVKELMNNAVKHARASEVTVIVRWLGERVRISVADNGCGFPLEEAPAPWREQGLGLTDMRERVALLGGEVHIESKPGEGAQVILEIPLAETGAEPG